MITLTGTIKLEPDDIRNDHVTVAETIENNLRRKIMDAQPVTPKYF